MKYEITSSKAIGVWDEALPLGNGLSGCLLWGNGSPLRFSLDRGDLWDLRAAPEVEKIDYTYKELIRLVHEKNVEAMNLRFDDFYNRPTPTKIPCGRIELNFGKQADRVLNRLNLLSATAEVNLSFGSSSATVSTYLHAMDGIGRIRVNGSYSMPEIAIVSPDFRGIEKTSLNDNKWEPDLSSLGYPPGVMGQDDSVYWYVQKTCTELEYGIVVAVKQTQSEMEAAYIISSNKDDINWLEVAKQKVKAAVEKGYESSMQDHLAWWQQYWHKSEINLPDKIFEKNWYITNYLFGSCSRKGAPPMPLQGVWTADEGKLPPWKGDYHHDLNTQMSYWHYMTANHLEEGESFIDFLWDRIPAARKFAKEFFDAPGICLPSVMAFDGTSLGGWPMYATNLVNQLWLCQAFDHYWKTTGDVQFLKEKAYIYFKESAYCVMRWLKPGDDGKLILPLSSSPEIHNNTLRSWLTPNSNNDLALLTYTFKTLAEMAEKLGYEDEVRQWRDVLDRLPDFAVNEQHILMLSPDESLEESHRHLSHLMAFYPLHLIDYDSTELSKKIIDATVGDLEKLGKGLWLGFTYGWMASIYAKQRNGEASYYHLKLFWENLCSPNGFHLNEDFKRRGLSYGHRRAFTLESNMAAANALQEMLMQNHSGVIDVFPAIPDDWREQEVSFRDFRGGMGALVSASMVQGELAQIKLYAEQDGEFYLKNNFKVQTLHVCKDQQIQGIDCTVGQVFMVKMQRGETVSISG
ncbi:glycosyl hydrolase family 95 catalytic domain-containing protein [Paenibacillus eucommiae]|uniref:Alpha-L-fucosidase 2 n=1 Tax=Paenibacillus eucommiae TaxID=1355755 RepID=A0ABS4ITL7_9BACL|nr:hypothetical protein [Paenibacillus eucommiae]MBP1990221.1 alpha-L-fucosidase 2 [Paenibacillus eucommiae]